jgi:hypothetical protein
MKQIIGFIFIIVVLAACNGSTPSDKPVTKKMALEGTWQLFSATIIEKGDTVHTDFTKGQSMIKVINSTHFAFLRHDLNKGKDSAIYSSGGGTYTLAGDQYTERLEFCSDREWEGHTFPFSVLLSNDTLVQTGVEKLDNLGINRLNIEKYVRVKN